MKEPYGELLSKLQTKYEGIDVFPDEKCFVREVITVITFEFPLHVRLFSELALNRLFQLKRNF